MVKRSIPALDLKLRIQASPFYPKLTRTFQQLLDDTQNQLPEPKKSFQKKEANKTGPGGVKDLTWGQQSDKVTNISPAKGWTKEHGIFYHFNCSRAKTVQQVT